MDNNRNDSFRQAVRFAAEVVPGKVMRIRNKKDTSEDTPSRKGR